MGEMQIITPKQMELQVQRLLAEVRSLRNENALLREGNQKLKPKAGLFGQCAQTPAMKLQAENAVLIAKIGTLEEEYNQLKHPQLNRKGGPINQIQINGNKYTIKCIKNVTHKVTNQDNNVGVLLELELYDESSQRYLCWKDIKGSYVGEKIGEYIQYLVNIRG